MFAKVRNYDVIKIYGVGETTASKFHDAGFGTIDLLAHSSPSEINQKTGIAMGLSTQHFSRARMALNAIAGIGDFSKTETCPDCSGRGVLYRDESCQKCGGSKKIIFNDKDQCVNCSGSGVFTGKTIADCNVCGGDGIVTLDNSVSCGICKGSGVEKYTKETKCLRCNGQGYTTGYYSKTCSQCEGDGLIDVWDKYANGYMKKCPTCNGLGYSGLNFGWSLFLSIIAPIPMLLTWAVLKCDTCHGSGMTDYYHGGFVTERCTACDGSGRISQLRDVDCPECIGGVINNTSTRQCTACGGDGQLESTTDVRCSACNGLKKELKIIKERCLDCAGTGFITEQHELGCHVCGETGVLTDFEETKCLRCRGEGVIADSVTGFTGMNFETFVNTPTEDLVSAGMLDETNIIRMKRAVGTLYFVLDEPCMQELLFE